MIIVTGGAGYVGSHCVKELLKRGYEVGVVDNLATGHRASVGKDARFFEGDIRDGEFMTKVFKETNAEAVVHFAACSLVGESMTDPLKYYNNNVHGTEVLLASMLRADVDKIIFSSTAAVYGEAKTDIITEDIPKEPTNTYGETKLSMEKMMKWCDKAYGMRHVALRYFNVAGADPEGTIGEDHSPETHLIPIILQVPLKKREKLSIFGDDYPTPDGTCIRDYVHVCDLARAHAMALEYLVRGGESNVFNLASGGGYSVKEMLDAAREVTGDPIPATVEPRRAGDPARLVADASKAANVLGFKPEKTSVKEIIGDAWRWHSSHPNGFGE